MLSEPITPKVAGSVITPFLIGDINGEMQHIGTESEALTLRTRRRLVEPPKKTWIKLAVQTHTAAGGRGGYRVASVARAKELMEAHGFRGAGNLLDWTFPSFVPWAHPDNTTGLVPAHFRSCLSAATCAT